jgi:hypothetical protein
MGSAVPGLRAYLYETLLPALYPDGSVQILYGAPPPYGREDIVSVGNCRTTTTMPVMSAARPMEELTEITVTISCSRFGPGPEMQQEATERAYDLFDAWRDHCKTPGQETFGGLAMWGFVTGHDLVEAEDPETVGTARNAAIAVTITVKTRT